MARYKSSSCVPGMFRIEQGCPWNAWEHSHVARWLALQNARHSQDMIPSQDWIPILCHSVKILSSNGGMICSRRLIQRQETPLEYSRGPAPGLVIRRGPCRMYATDARAGSRSSMQPMNHWHETGRGRLLARHAVRDDVRGVAGRSRPDLSAGAAPSLDEHAEAEANGQERKGQHEQGPALGP